MDKQRSSSALTLAESKLSDAVAREETDEQRRREVERKMKEAEERIKAAEDREKQADQRVAEATRAADQADASKQSMRSDLSKEVQRALDARGEASNEQGRLAEREASLKTREQEFEARSQALKEREATFVQDSQNLAAEREAFEAQRASCTQIIDAAKAALDGCSEKFKADQKLGEIKLKTRQAKLRLEKAEAEKTAELVRAQEKYPQDEILNAVAKVQEALLNEKKVYRCARLILERAEAQAEGSKELVGSLDVDLDEFSDDIINKAVDIVEGFKVSDAAKAEV